MQIVAATVEHAKRLELQVFQHAHTGLLRDDAYLRALFEQGFACAAVDGERVLGIGGLHDIGGGVCRAWAWLAYGLTTTMLRIHRAVLRGIEMSEYRRVEVIAACGHPEGNRWAHMLGCQFEGRMRAYMPDGNDANLFARVKHGI